MLAALSFINEDDCLCIYKPGSDMQHCSVIGKGKHEKVWPLSLRYKTHTTVKSIVWERNVTLCSGKFVFFISWRTKTQKQSKGKRSKLAVSGPRNVPKHRGKLMSHCMCFYTSTCLSLSLKRENPSSVLFSHFNFFQQ